jgi:hypothetical protein
MRSLRSIRWTHQFYKNIQLCTWTGIDRLACAGVPEIDLATRADGTVNRSVNGNGKVNVARNLKEEKKCDRACGGKGLGKGLCKGGGEYDGDSNWL